VFDTALEVVVVEDVEVVVGVEGGVVVVGGGVVGA